MASRSSGDFADYDDNDGWPDVNFVFDNPSFADVDEPVLICKICKKAAFLLPELMDHHYKTEHDSELIFTMMGIMAEDSNGAGGGNGKVKGSDDGNNNNAVEKGHGEGTSKDRPVCEECGAVFTREENLRIHRRKKNCYFSHTKPGKCSTCDEEFESQLQLKIHTRKFHTGGKIIRCKRCGAEFLGRGDMQRHKKSHHKM